MTEPITISIDPGSTKSALVVLSGHDILEFVKAPNAEVFDALRRLNVHSKRGVIYCEFPFARHQPASNDLFETAYWAGRFSLACNLVPFVKVNRAQVLQWFKVRKRTAKDKRLGIKVPNADSQIRTAIINMYGGVDKAIGGGKCKPCKGKGRIGRGLPKIVCQYCYGSGLKNLLGPLAGITADCWQALAVGLYAQDVALAQGGM